MDWTRSTTLKILGVFCLTLSTVPSFAAAQAGGGRGGGAAGAGLAQFQQVLSQLDLTDDQQTKVKGILKEAQASMRDTMQGLQDATPQERQAKMQDLQKQMNDTREKIETELTPEQKAKYFPLAAKAGLKRATDMLAAIKTASDKMDIKDDDKKPLATILDDNQKTLDGYKDEADGVKDEATSTEFTQKLTKFQLDLRKQIQGVLGQDDTQKLMQDARQSMRPAAGAGQRNRKATTTDAK